MKRFFGLFGLVSSFIICGSAGGLVALFVFAKLPNTCHGDNCAPLQPPGLPADCVSAKAVVQINSLALMMSGNRDLPSLTEGDFASTTCSPIATAVYSACVRADGGLSGKESCSLLKVEK